MPNVRDVFPKPCVDVTIRKLKQRADLANVFSGRHLP